MTTYSSFSSFAAHLRGFIHWHSCADNEWGGQIHCEETEFNALASALFTLQFEHNLPYRQFCQSRKADPASVRHWSEIPAMPTAAFKELELSSLPPEQRTRVFYSSGTTAQQPSLHFHNDESLALYEASLVPSFQAHLLGSPQSQARNLRTFLPSDEMHCIFFTPSSADAPHSSLAHMFETIQRQLPWRKSIFAGKVGVEGVWLLDLDKCLTALGDSIATRRPVTLMGTAFNFVHLLDFLEKINRRLRLPAGSRLMETGGYKGRSRSLPKPELHALIGDWLGISPEHIICEYGMSELSSQAYDSTFGNHHARERIFRFPPWARAQIISPETGLEVAEAETGLIRIFDLANVRSVMATQTEDLGIRRGDGFELLGRAVRAEPRGCSLMAV